MVGYFLTLQCLQCHQHFRKNENVSDKIGRRQYIPQILARRPSAPLAWLLLVIVVAIDPPSHKMSTCTEMMASTLISALVYLNYKLHKTAKRNGSFAARSKV